MTVVQMLQLFRAEKILNAMHFKSEKPIVDNQMNREHLYIVQTMLALPPIAMLAI